MPFTRKQKASEKHSGQSDLISDLGDMNMMIRFFSENKVENNSMDRETEEKKAKELRKLLSVSI